MHRHQVRQHALVGVVGLDPLAEPCRVLLATFTMCDDALPQVIDFVDHHDLLETLQRIREHATLASAARVNTDDVGLDQLLERLAEQLPAPGASRFVPILELAPLFIHHLERVRADAPFLQMHHGDEKRDLVRRKPENDLIDRVDVKGSQTAHDMRRGQQCRRHSIDGDGHRVEEPAHVPLPFERSTKEPLDGTVSESRLRGSIEFINESSRAPWKRTRQRQRPAQHMDQVVKRHLVPQNDPMVAEPRADTMLEQRHDIGVRRDPDDRNLVRGMMRQVEQVVQQRLSGALREPLERVNDDDQRLVDPRRLTQHLQHVRHVLPERRHADVELAAFELDMQLPRQRLQCDPLSLVCRRPDRWTTAYDDGEPPKPWSTRFSAWIMAIRAWCAGPTTIADRDSPWTTVRPSRTRSASAASTTPKAAQANALSTSGSDRLSQVACSSGRSTRRQHALATSSSPSMPTEQHYPAERPGAAACR